MSIDFPSICENLCCDRILQYAAVSAWLGPPNVCAAQMHGFSFLTNDSASMLWPKLIWLQMMHKPELDKPIKRQSLHTYWNQRVFILIPGVILVWDLWLWDFWVLLPLITFPMTLILTYQPTRNYDPTITQFIKDKKWSPYGKRCPCHAKLPSIGCLVQGL